MAKQCEKVKFSSEEFCEFHIAKHKESNREKGLTARSYLCKCGSWHITSKPLISDVIGELNDKIEELTIDNEALKEQLIEQIKDNVNLKYEVQLLNQFKNVKKNKEPQDIRIIKHQLNVSKAKVAEQQKQISTLLNKLNQIK